MTLISVSNEEAGDFPSKPRWSANRKIDVVLRLLRGQSLEGVSRHSRWCLCRSCEASPGSSLSIEGSMRACLLEVCGNNRDVSTDARRQVLGRLCANFDVSC